MADFVTLTCPSCGGKLQITPDLETFACAFCGNEHIVKREGGIISLAPLEEGIRKVRDGVDKVAAELAIKRLEEKVEQVRAKLKGTPAYFRASESKIRKAKARYVDAKGELKSGGYAMATAVTSGVIILMVVISLSNASKMGFFSLPTLFWGGIVGVIWIAVGMWAFRRRERVQAEFAEAEFTLRALEGKKEPNPKRADFEEEFKKVKDELARQKSIVENG